MLNRQERWILLIWVGIFWAGLICAATPTPNDPTLLLQAIRAGDLAFEKFDNHAALESYRRAVRLDSTNYEALWKLTRAYIDAGQSAPRKEQIQYYFRAEHTARQCVSLHPDSAEGHFFLAVALGRTALYVGGKRKIQIAREVKVEAERALQINPAHDGAMHVLARWHYEVASLNFVERAVAKIVFGGVPPGASYERAAEYYEQAIVHNPEAPVHRLEYGRTLLKLGRVAESREQLKKCLKLPNLFWDDPKHKLQAQKLLDKIAKS
jgi:tetratricopeptide (TPR) repeat protein